VDLVCLFVCWLVVWFVGWLVDWLDSLYTYTLVYTSVKSPKLSYLMFLKIWKMQLIGSVVHVRKCGVCLMQGLGISFVC
jgi:hypothetical protein